MTKICEWIRRMFGAQERKPQPRPKPQSEWAKRAAILEARKRQNRYWNGRWQNENTRWKKSNGNL